MNRITSGIFVNVCNGPHCGANGEIDFVDRPKRRALVDFGGGRAGGLTWVPFDCLRAKDGSELEGGAKLRRT